MRNAMEARNTDCECEARDEIVTGKRADFFKSKCLPVDLSKFVHFPTNLLN